MPLLVIEMTQMMYLRILMITPSIQTKVTESLAQKVVRLFFRRRAVSISIVFITKTYFNFAKSVKVSSICFYIMKVPKKRELQQIVYNHYAGMVL